MTGAVWTTGPMAAGLYWEVNRNEPWDGADDGIMDGLCDGAFEFQPEQNLLRLSALMNMEVKGHG